VEQVVRLVTAEDLARLVTAVTAVTAVTVVGLVRLVIQRILVRVEHQVIQPLADILEPVEQVVKVALLHSLERQAKVVHLDLQDRVATVV